MLWSLTISRFRGRRWCKMADTRLYDWLATLAREFQDENYGPSEISGPFGTHGCLYGEDEDGKKFVTVGFNMPPDVWAELEDGTYGELQGWRIYLTGGDNDDQTL